MTQQLPNEQIASRVDIEAAIRSLTDADKTRINDYAEFLAWKVDCGKEELINEAMSAVLDTENRRRWKKDRVSFLQLLLGTIRSLASNWAKQRSRRLETLVSKDGSTSPIQRAHSREPDPERAAISRDILDRIRAEFASDQLVLDIIGGLDGMTRSEIIAALDIDETTYDSAARRLRRRAHQLFPQGER